jgi:hypothetical protein
MLSPFRMRLAITACFLLCAAHCASQVAPDSSARIRLASGGADSSLPASFQPTKSPWLAVGLSAVLPGAGQIYDESYWKAPIIWGVGGYWISQWISLNGKYGDFRDLYAKSIQLTGSGNENDRRLRDFYRDERDRFAWFLGALYFLNLVDAYVGAHLYDFDVGPQLSANGRVVPRVCATVKLRF